MAAYPNQLKVIARHEATLYKFIADNNIYKAVWCLAVIASGAVASGKWKIILYIWKKTAMETIIIQTQSKSTKKLLLELAKKMGEKALVLDKDTAEDLLLGKMMNEKKTGKLVSKESVLSAISQ